MAFKMKYSPIKGVFGDFFKNIGAKKTDMGKLREKQARSSKGVSEYQHRVEESKRKRREARKAKTTDTPTITSGQEIRGLKLVPKEKVKSRFSADLGKKWDPLTGKFKSTFDPSNIDLNVSKIKMTPKPTPESESWEDYLNRKPHYFTFSGKKGDKFKYRSRTDKKMYEGGYEFQRPGSDVWETPKTKAGSDAIGDLWTGGDYEGRNVEMTPIQKKSPTKKSGFKMKNSPVKIYNKAGKRRKNYKY